MGAVLLAGATSSALADGRADASSALAAGSADAAVVVDARGGPALAFTSREYSFHPTAFLFCDQDAILGCETKTSGPDWGEHNDELVLGNWYFDRVSVQARDGDASGVMFAVEGVSGDARRHCRNVNEGCGDVSLGVREDSGLLYMFLAGYHKFEHHYAMNGHQVISAELSAEDSASDLVVYREVAIGPSEQASACGDYPSADRDRFTCLFSGEILPSERPQTPPSLRDSLPNLVQPKENYSLIFAEEFNGTPTEDDCRAGLDNGMPTLDDGLWNYDPNPCNNTDSLGEPCEKIQGGRYSMSKIYDCRGTLSTFGKFSYKYGYLEVKYTVNTASNDFWQNYAFYAEPTAAPYNDHGIVVDSYEDLARAGRQEMDFFEHVPDGRYTRSVSHSYINAYSQKYDDDGIAAPRRINRWNWYCRASASWSTTVGMTHPGCSNNGQITVTIGLEWTPAGYRSFQKVDGHDDELAVRPENKIEAQHKTLNSSTDKWGSWQSYRGADRDRFFTLLDPDDPDSLLEAIAVAHRPIELIVRAHGHARAQHDTIRTRLEVDYIRIFQPENLYTDMEPVYQ